MTESYSNKYDRSNFKPGEQKVFLHECLFHSDLNNFTSFAKNNNLHPKTVSEWKNEKYRMSHSLVQKLSKKYNVTIPKSYTKVNSLDLQKMDGKKGGKVVFEKYGRIGVDPILRQKGWEKWWLKHGINKPNSILQQTKISIPKRSSSLAEFFGIMLGDGGLSEYQTRITLNIESDADYIIYVQALIHKLFKEKSSIIRSKTKATAICVSRKRLTKFLVKNGLCIGDKVRVQIDIPDWIKENQNFLRLCIRGLYDTDGGVYFEKHRYKDKEYSYIRLSFVNASKPLLESVFKALQDFGIPSRLNIKRSVTIEGLRNVSKYFNLVGTSNLKHSLKYENFRKLDKYKEKWQSGLSHSS